MAKIYQIGAGMIGQTMALDLAEGHDVFLGDINIDDVSDKIKNHSSIDLLKVDAQDIKQVSSFILDADIVLLAVPGHLGFKILKTIIECGKNVVDISFSPEDIMDLNRNAIENDVTVVFDAGVAPGIPNYIFGYHNTVEKITSFKYFVGGLPKFPKGPFNYKAPFSPIDVIEEYTRPARMMINGKLITKPALSDIEIINFNNEIELEAFNTDGLRSLLQTMPHVNNMNLEKDEPEFTILKVEIETDEKIISYELFDEFDEVTKSTSMARTTGYTATATINLILEGLFETKGVFPPENVCINKNIFDFILNYLAKRHVRVQKDI